MEPLLRVERLTKRFGDVVAVNDVSLAIPPGVALGLIGPNGSGKTTLMKCCTGLLRPDEGRVFIVGRDLLSGDIEAKRPLAFAPELPQPVRMLTPWDHLAFIGSALDLPDWQIEAERLLLAFDLLPKRDRLAISMSKGEQQKIMLCMAFLRRPQVLFLDEPLIGLDPRAALNLKREVRALIQRGGCALISSHILPLVEELCAALAVMSRGRLAFFGSPEGLRVAAAKAPGSPLDEAFVMVTEPGEGP